MRIKSIIMNLRVTVRHKISSSRNQLGVKNTTLFNNSIIFPFCNVLGKRIQPIFSKLVNLIKPWRENTNMALGKFPVSRGIPPAQFPPGGLPLGEFLCYRILTHWIPTRRIPILSNFHPVNSRLWDSHPVIFHSANFALENFFPVKKWKGITN